jgi:hypothetical protein
MRKVNLNAALVHCLKIAQKIIRRIRKNQRRKVKKMNGTYDFS